MTRKLKPLGFDDLGRLPVGCGECSFWESAGERARRCGSVCDADHVRDWFLRVNEEWGACGRVAVEDDAVLGFIKYAPSAYFPQAITFPARPNDPSVPLIACLHIAPEARHRGLGGVLIRAALRDLAQRGERRVEAFGAAQALVAPDESPMIGLDFLLRIGFTVSNPDPRYPLLRLDLRSLVTLTDNIETVYESLKLPRMAPKRAPATWMNGR